MSVVVFGAGWMDGTFGQKYRNKRFLPGMSSHLSTSILQGRDITLDKWRFPQCQEPSAVANPTIVMSLDARITNHLKCPFEVGSLCNANVSVWVSACLFPSFFRLEKLFRFVTHCLTRV